MCNHCFCYNRGMSEGYVAKTIAAYDQSSDKYEASTTGMTPPAEFGRFTEMVAETSRFVLDAGCAFGRDSTEFLVRGFTPIGIDLSDELLKKAVANNPDIEFHKMDIRDLGFADESFDGIWCHAALLHLNDEDIAKALGEFHRVLKPNGTLFVSFKKGEGTQEVVENFSSDAARFYNFKTKETLSTMLQDTGFKGVNAYYVNEQDLFGPDKRDLDWVHCFSRKA